MCYQCRLAIGTDLVELFLGHGCPSQRQLFLMDGFQGLLAPCSQFTVFPLKVIINLAIATAPHNFLFSEGHPSIHPRLALMYRLCQVMSVLLSSLTHPCLLEAQILDCESLAAPFGERISPRWRQQLPEDAIQPRGAVNSCF